MLEAGRKTRAAKAHQLRQGIVVCCQVDPVQQYHKHRKEETIKAYLF